MNDLRPEEIMVGSRVAHEMFGPGTVRRVYCEDSMATVHFDRMDENSLLVSIGNLRTTGVVPRGIPFSPRPNRVPGFFDRTAPERDPTQTHRSTLEEFRSTLEELLRQRSTLEELLRQRPGEPGFGRVGWRGESPETGFPLFGNYPNVSDNSPNITRSPNPSLLSAAAKPLPREFVAETFRQNERPELATTITYPDE